MGYTYACMNQVYIADGFNDDCERLIDRCLKAGKVTYEVFCELWKEMGFDMLYRGRSSSAEIAELSEELVYIAKLHMLSTTEKFEASVAGLFIVYALLNMQPYRGFATLRLVPEDVPMVMKLDAVARRAKRLDVLYILGALLVQHTQYHAAERERGMETTYRKYLEGYLNIDKSTIRPYGVFSHRNEELDLLQDISRLTTEYSQIKETLSNKVNAKNLNYLNHRLATELDTSLRNIIGGFTEDNSDNEGGDNSSNQKSKVQEIKERAMKHCVGQMKHLTGVNERNNIIQSDTKMKSDIKTKSGKIKTSSPTKPATPKKRAALSKSSNTSPSPTKSSPSTSKSSPNPSKSSPSTSKSSPGTSKSSPSTSKSSPSTSKSSPNPSKSSPSTSKSSPSTSKSKTSRKRRKPLTPKRRHWKAKKKIVSESDCDNDFTKLAELNLDDFDESEDPLLLKTNETAHDEQIVETNELTDENQIVDTNIQIDKLPCFITTVQNGTTFEIEIIDKQKPEQATAKSNEEETMIVESENDGNVCIANDNSKKIKLRSHRLKKIEKRDMKKVIVKSKFKRLGILPVANFDEK